MVKRIVVYAVVIGVCVAVGVTIGLHPEWFTPAPTSSGNSSLGYSVTGAIEFQDQVVSADPPAVNVQELSFVDLAGNPVRLNDYRDKKNVVLVITRGYAGSICIYCSTQTSRLVAQYPEIAARDAEVVLVYPVKEKQDERRLDEFLQNVKKQLDAPPERLPFPVTLDTGLTAVDQLGIRRDLAKPATYILDKQGKVRFSYVGATLADRPSVKAILGQLDALQPDAK